MLSKVIDIKIRSTLRYWQQCSRLKLYKFCYIFANVLAHILSPKRASPCCARQHAASNKMRNLQIPFKYN